MSPARAAAHHSQCCLRCVAKFTFVLDSVRRRGCKYDDRSWAISLIGRGPYFLSLMTIPTNRNQHHTLNSILSSTDSHLPTPNSRNQIFPHLANYGSSPRNHFSSPKCQLKFPTLLTHLELIYRRIWVLTHIGHPSCITDSQTTICRENISLLPRNDMAKRNSHRETGHTV